MHELALMHALCDLALQTAQQEGAYTIHSLQVRIGDLSGVDGEALRQAFAVVTMDPNWKDTRLELAVVPTRCFCSNCQQAFKPTDVIHQCPHCGLLSHEVVQGRELELIGMEVS